jgi:hypothetical protein
MENYILISSFAIGLSLSAQCDATKCVGDSANVISNYVGASGTTFDWQVNPPLAFTGQGTEEIHIIDVGAAPGQYTITLTASSGASCDTVASVVLCVVEGTATLVLNPTCSSTPVPVSGGSPGGGQYFINGNPVTSISSADDGQLLTYVNTSSGCPGTASGVINFQSPPNINITIN